MDLGMGKLLGISFPRPQVLAKAKQQARDGEACT